AAAIVPAFQPSWRTLSPCPRQKCPAVASSRTCPDGAQLKSAPPPFLPPLAPASLPRSLRPQGFPSRDFALPCPCPHHAAALPVSAGLVAPASSTAAQSFCPTRRCRPLIPADVQSFAANAHPPCIDDSNRAPPANRCAQIPATLPSTVPISASAAAPRLDNPRSEFRAA